MFSIDISETLLLCPSRSCIFWTTFRKYSLFPEACWTEQHLEFVLLSSKVHTWEYLVLPGLFRVSRRILSPRCAVSRDETTCFCFHRWRTSWRAFLRSFRHFSLLSCGKKRMAVGKVAAGKCGVVHEVNKDATNYVTHHAWNYLLLKNLRVGFWIPRI